MEEFVEILKRIILPNKETLPEAVAREFLGYRFDDTDRERMEALAEKARLGTMMPDDMIEASGFERIGSLLGILQSKARRSLGDQL